MNTKQQLPRSTDVLIVGAGPTGMTLAVSLQQLLRMDVSAAGRSEIQSAREQLLQFRDALRAGTAPIRSTPHTHH